MTEILEVVEEQQIEITNEFIEVLDNSIFYNKHYITLDENCNIINGFSDAFYQSSESDICINNLGGRHFVIDGVENPQLVDKQVYLYKYVDSEVVKKTDEEISIELQNVIKPTLKITDEQKAIDMMKYLMQSDEFLTTVGITPITTV